jgi:hypothetical protein
MAVFWFVAPCSLVEVYRRFRGVYCFHHQGLMMEAAKTSETSENYQTTRRSNLEGSHLHTSSFFGTKIFLVTLFSSLE